MSNKQSRIDKIKKFRELSIGNLWEHKDEEIPELEFLVDKVIIAGQVHIIFGLGGTFKSTICLYLAISMCAGVPTEFGNTVKSKILWIDEEMGYEGLVTKADLIAKSIGLTDDEWKKNFYYRSMSDFNAELPDGVAQVTGDITKDDINCIFIDSLTAVTDGETSENARNLRKFNKVAYQTGCAIVHIHHIAKIKQDESTLTKEALRGSVDFGNQMDMVFAITDVGYLRIKQVKGRHIKKSDCFDINIDIAEKDDCFNFILIGDTKDVVSGKIDKIKSCAKVMKKYIISKKNQFEYISHNLKDCVNVKEYGGNTRNDAIKLLVKEHFLDSIKGTNGKYCRGKEYKR